MSDLFAQAILPLFELTRADWLATARNVARYIASQKGEVTIDDIRAVWPPPENVDPRVMGAVFRTAEFIPIGYRKSKRKTCHNRPIAVFKCRLVKAA